MSDATWCVLTRTIVGRVSILRGLTEMEAKEAYQRLLPRGIGGGDSIWQIEIWDGANPPKEAIYL